MMENKPRKVSIVVPCYNEEEALPLFYARLEEVIGPLSGRYDFEILFINDGSTDGTLSSIRSLKEKDPRVAFVDLSRNYGKEIGMLAGFDHASGDCLITIDADLQEPPEVIPLMLEEWEKGACDVYGKRRERQQSPVKKITSRTFHRFLSSISDVDLTDDAGDFRLLDRRCIDALSRMRESQRYTKGMYAWIGFSKAPVEYDIAERVAGTTKWTFSRLARLAADGIMSHSVLPLRLASFAGIVVSLCAFVYLVWVIVKSIIWGDRVAGYPSLMAVMLFLGGFILLALGIIGEYLGRIFLETKRRPPYFVNEFIQSGSPGNANE